MHCDLLSPISHSLLCAKVFYTLWHLSLACEEPFPTFELVSQPSYLTPTYCLLFLCDTSLLSAALPFTSVHHCSPFHTCLLPVQSLVHLMLHKELLPPKPTHYLHTPSQTSCCVQPFSHSSFICTIPLSLTPTSSSLSPVCHLWSPFYTCWLPMRSVHL